MADTPCCEQCGRTDLHLHRGEDDDARSPAEEEAQSRLRHPCNTPMDQEG